MIKTKAYAKINLNLHLLPKIPANDLYPTQFINCQIDLYDELLFKRSPYIDIISDNPDLPRREHNLAYKAACLLKRIINKPSLGVKIYLTKNIPVKAGFGGGSSDAAATVKSLLKLWQISLTEKQLGQLAENLGKDVFYFLKGGLCEVLGDGNIVRRLSLTLPTFYLVIICPEKTKPSTSWMYKNLNADNIGKNSEKFELLKKGLKQNNKTLILNSLFNDFERLIMSKFPEVPDIKQHLYNNGARKILVAGSGLSVVGFFLDKKSANIAFCQLKVKYKNIIISQTL